MNNHTDTYALAGPRSCVLTYPPDLTTDEARGVGDWLEIVAWKLEQMAQSPATLDALRRNELADADAHLAESQERCDRYRAERDALEANFAAWRDRTSDEAHALRAACAELETELAHQRKLVDTLCERVAAQSELLSQRSAKPKEVPLVVPEFAALRLDGTPFGEYRADPAPKVTVIDDPEADLPAVLPVPDAPYPSVPAVVESQTYRDDKEHVPPGVPHGNSPEPRKRVNRGRETRIKIAAALVAKPLTVTQIHAATGIPQGTLGGTLCMRGGGWWAKRFHHKGSPYELTDAGRAALRAEGIDAPDPPAPKGIDRDRERCRLIAQEMAKLVAPQPVIVLATATGFDPDDVRAYLVKRPEWFARVEGGGEYYRLTSEGRALASEQEAA